ncbi:hypothetical protein Ae168Ps1_4107 [Pseudonocardia sp. Ae168_Ps1]|nr:hypothetical protein Ae150APs1_4080 [Pseudonocardia sp. Ae150A_Ps1]OLL81701.1 hypothetical protein Ae168Ps1_4107 [Pseudonocardia sp. Ae168_Ps1]OLL84186.1 hypothetical protein Ae263Ps1_1241c [Pseudonocardia sp. Ae263_Ps1]OLL95796.1 hypothetical protein Ae356Ps1_5693 [Pseudonocardia sp. Ae356_Ps1]
MSAWPARPGSRPLRRPGAGDRRPECRGSLRRPSGSGALGRPCPDEPRRDAGQRDVSISEVR